MAKRAFEAWENPDKTSLTFTTTESAQQMREQGLLDQQAHLLFTVEADSYEEAMAIRNLRMGWEPYQPQGAAAPCPKCRAFYYPEGSGECWNCSFTI